MNTKTAIHGRVSLRLPRVKPFYMDRSCAIYLIDCLEGLQKLPTVDITVSSPPYNQIGRNAPTGMFASHQFKMTGGYAEHHDDMPELKYGRWMRTVFELCRSRSRGLVWINHKTRYRNRFGIHPLHLFPWPYYSEIVWDRCGSITLNARKFAPSHEFLYGFGTPHYWDSTQNGRCSVWRIPPERKVPGHPCPFPVEIAQRCITASCPPGGVVLDPFAGSGSTLIAAKQSDRRAIGFEITKEYCEIAVERLKAD